MMYLFLEFICAITAVISIYIYGNQAWYAPIFGLFSQIFWVTWTVVGGHFPMLILSCAMIMTHCRNFKTMGTKKKLKQIWWK